MTTRPPLKLAIFGTHPQQFNGYAKVIYELIQEMSKMESEVRVYVFGFQNLAKEQTRGPVPENVTVYDAYADETPKKQGFGIELVKNYLALCDPDVVVVYNDMVIITSILNEMKDIPNRRFKIIAYIDQVYLCQKKAHIDFVNQHADFALLFSQNWERCIKDQGLTLPSDYIPHGVNTGIYYPVPHHIVRKYYGFSDDEFIILNMNRNQPRKRWDLTMKAYAEVLRRLRLPERQSKLPEGGGSSVNVKLVIATSPRGAWNLPEIFAKELHKRGIPLEEGLKYIVFVDAPQRMSDREVNMLYNLCDIGINTCDGEGFGLCNVEQAAVGKPQVVTRLGAFADVFDDTCAIPIEPKCEFYLDSTRDAVGGEALMCSHVDFADAILRYYEDPEMRRRHGKVARERILKTYRWDDIAKKLVRIAKYLYGSPPVKENEEDEEYDVDEVMSLMGDASALPSSASSNENNNNGDKSTEDEKESTTDFAFDITSDPSNSVRQDEKAPQPEANDQSTQSQSDGSQVTALAPGNVDGGGSGESKKKQKKQKKKEGRANDSSLEEMKKQLEAIQAMMASFAKQQHGSSADDKSDNDTSSSEDDES